MSSPNLLASLSDNEEEARLPVLILGPKVVKNSMVSKG